MMTRNWGLVLSATVALLLFQAQVLPAQGLAERLRPDLDRAWALGRARQYDQQLEVYDKLVAAPELSASIPFRPFDVLKCRFKGRPCDVDLTLT